MNNITQPSISIKQQLINFISMMDNEDQSKLTTEIKELTNSDKMNFKDIINDLNITLLAKVSQNILSFENPYDLNKKLKANLYYVFDNDTIGIICPNSESRC